MEECGDHLTIVPRAVRRYEAEQSSLFVGELTFEQCLRIAGTFQNPYAFAHMGLLRLLMPLDVALQALLTRSPLARHLVEEITAELVDIRCIETVVFNAQPFEVLICVEDRAGIFTEI